MAPPSVTSRPVELKTLTTLGVGGPAELWEVENEADLLIATHEPYRVIGAGSNLLVADSGVPERVIKLGRAYNSLHELDLESRRGKSDSWLGRSHPVARSRPARGGGGAVGARGSSRRARRAGRRGGDERRHAFRRDVRTRCRRSRFL